MRPVVLLLTFLISGGLIALPHPASAGPGAGGGYEKTPKRIRASKPKKHAEVWIGVRRTA